MYRLGGAEKQSIYASNGDYLLDPVPYSIRLIYVESYLQKKKLNVSRKHLKNILNTKIIK